MLKYLLLSTCCFLLLALGGNAHAVDPIRVPSKEKIAKLEKIEALLAILGAKKNLEESLKTHQEQLKTAISETEKDNLLQKINAIEKELLDADLNFEEIATDTNLRALGIQSPQTFSLRNELSALIKPTIQEMNHLTSDVRRKSELREKITSIAQKREDITQAIAHLSELSNEANGNKLLQAALSAKAEYWTRQRALAGSQYKSAEQQLKKMEADEVSFAESTQNYFNQFFRTRGLYLFQAFIAMLTVYCIVHFVGTRLKKHVPAFTRHSRSFRIRLLDLIHRIITFILVIICPAIVFYIAEDWLLFSLSLLILFGIAWTLRTVIPEYRQQIQLFLNVGSVREGERILMDGIPWRVNAINVFSTIENPVAGIKQRIPIKDLTTLKSRPNGDNEPWFPCAKDDWIMLSDGVRGKVVGISIELIKLIQRGGGHKTYLTSEFLALAPQNLSMNFRIKETFGISYDLQTESTTSIPDILHQTIVKRVADEGYSEDLLNLRVEFEYANTSSLDLVVIADFKGEVADLYNRLRRAIQRWSVDACTENGWEIPFTQIAIHNSSEAHAN